MRKLIILTFLILPSSVFISAQATKDSACPNIPVSGPAGIAAPGELTTFSAQITSIDPATNIEYLWSASAGEIVSGQGTATISVRQPTSNLLTVTLEVKGLPAECPNVASETTIWDPALQAIKLGDISDITSVSTSELFDRIARDAEDNPNSQLFILSGHIDGKATAAVSAKEQEILRDLVAKGLPKGQISLVNVYADKEFFQFWLVPPGADNPRCKECEEFEKRAGNIQCPNISVSGPAGIVRPGDSAVFAANIIVDVSQKISYEWTVSGGTIENGSDSAVINVRTSPSLPDVVITATVKVTGLPAGCLSRASETANVVTPGDIFPVDEFGPASLNDEKARMDNIATQLNASKTGSALILIMLAPKESKESAIRRVKRLTNILTTRDQIPLDRFSFVYGNRDRSETIIYILPKDLMDSLLRGYDAKRTLDELRPPVTKPRK